MNQEIEVAVNWWAEKLKGNFKHNNGDAFQSMFANFAKEKMSLITDNQVSMFKERLSQILTSKFQEQDIWKVDNPNWGSYSRTISTDYAPAHSLREALEYANIDGGDLRLPIKTTMWIDPGEVRVAEGYGKQYIKIL